MQLKPGRLELFLLYRTRAYLSIEDRNAAKMNNHVYGIHDESVDSHELKDMRGQAGQQLTQQHRHHCSNVPILTYIVVGLQYGCA